MISTIRIVADDSTRAAALRPPRTGSTTAAVLAAADADATHVVVATTAPPGERSSTGASRSPASISSSTPPSACTRRPLSSTSPSPFAATPSSASSHSQRFTSCTIPAPLTASSFADPSPITTGRSPIAPQQPQPRRAAAGHPPRRLSHPMRLDIAPRNRIDQLTGAVAQLQQIARDSPGPRQSQRPPTRRPNHSPAPRSAPSTQPRRAASRRRRARDPRARRCWSYPPASTRSAPHQPPQIRQQHPLMRPIVPPLPRVDQRRRDLDAMLIRPCHPRRPQRCCRRRRNQ